MEEVRWRELNLDTTDQDTRDELVDMLEGVLGEESVWELSGGGSWSKEITY